MQHSKKPLPKHIRNSFNSVVTNHVHCKRENIMDTTLDKAVLLAKLTEAHELAEQFRQSKSALTLETTQLKLKNNVIAAELLILTTKLQVMCICLSGSRLPSNCSSKRSLFPNSGTKASFWQWMECSSRRKSPFTVRIAREWKETWRIVSIVWISRAPNQQTVVEIHWTRTGDQIAQIRARYRERQAHWSRKDQTKHPHLAWKGNGHIEQGNGSTLHEKQVLARKRNDPPGMSCINIPFLDLAKWIHHISCYPDRLKLMNY